MLRAVFHADRNTQHQRHAQHIGRHRLPLRHLVENLVSGASHKIAIHEFGHGAPTRQRITDRRTDDRRFRDRRIEESVIRDGFGQPAVGAKCPAPIAVFFTKGDHSRILIKALQHGFKDRFGISQSLELRQWITLLVQTETVFV